MDIHCDVLVIGGGPAGFGTAVTSARQGLNVYLLELNNKIGGVMATCPGMPIGGGYPCDKSIGGIFDEFVSHLYHLTPAAAEKRECNLDEFGPEVVYDHEIAIFTLYQILERAGVNLLLNTTVFKPLMKKERVEGIEFCDRTGKHKIYFKMIIDCSGDGDITAQAGVPYIKGDNDGKMMGVALTFFMFGVDVDKVFSENRDPYFRDLVAKGIEEGRLHEDLYKLYMIKGFYRNSVYFNSVNIKDIDGTNPMEVIRATNEARKSVFKLINYLREEVSGFENTSIGYLGPRVGIRETRHFNGIYKLTSEDIMSGKKFPDGIVCCDNPIDDVFRGSNIMSHNSIGKAGTYYTIPFRCMTPKKIENLLFAGRLISADPVAFASARGMSQCMVMGQACGMASHIAIKDRVSVQNISIEKLVKELQIQGVNGIGGEKL